MLVKEVNLGYKLWLILMEDMENSLRKPSKCLAKDLSKIEKDYALVVISGASSGIGEALAQTILSGTEKLRLCNLSRKPASIESDRLINIACDVSKIANLDAAFSEILGLLEGTKGKVLLINNSGFGGYGLFPEPNLQHNTDMIDVNVRGLTYLSGKFVEILRSRGGGIINVASTAAFQPCPYLNVYAATKSYVLNFSLALDYELRKFNCTCLCLCPGPTSTNFFRRAGFDKRPLKNDFGHEPWQVAETCIKAYCAGKNLKIVGALNFILSSLNKLVPLRFVGKFSGWILSKVRN